MIAMSLLISGLSKEVLPMSRTAAAAAVAGGIGFPHSSCGLAGTLGAVPGHCQPDPAAAVVAAYVPVTVVVSYPPSRVKDLSKPLNDQIGSRTDKRSIARKLTIPVCEFTNGLV